MLLLAGLCALLGLSFRLLLRTEMSAVSMVAGVETARVTKENGVGSIARQTERPLIVIDAGHGGMDGGALSADGISEKDINLAIALALQEEIRAYPADVLMTRSVDEGLYTEKSASIRAKKREDLLRRGEILNAESVTLGISIHLNSFPQDEKVYGAQVFYPKARAEGTDVSRACEQSKRYAEAIQKASKPASLTVGSGRLCQKMISFCFAASGGRGYWLNVGFCRIMTNVSASKQRNINDRQHARSGRESMKFYA